MSRITNHIGDQVIKMTDKIVRWLWCGCHQAQEVHPWTGAPLLYLEPAVDDAIPKSYPVDKLFWEVNVAMQVANTYITRVGSFTQRIDGGFMQTGVEQFGLALTDITQDVSKAASTRAGIVGDDRYIEDKRSLAELGAEKLISDWDIDKIVVTAPRIPRDELMCNRANDCLDCLSYELHGRHGETGDLIGISEKGALAAIKNRCFCANIYCQNTAHPDAENIRSVLWWIENNKTQKPAVIADYIDASLPKLPFVRRHWGL